jgi:predicted nucleic acid-binding protein
VGNVVVDASLVIGFFLPEDAHHASALSEIAAARTRGDEFVLPISVLSEALVGGYRNGTAPQLHQGIVALFGPARLVDEAIALSAAELRSRYRSLRLPDAWVIATGIADDAVVLTCDKRLASVDHRVQVVGG